MAILELNCQNQSLEWVKEPAEVYAGNVNVDGVKFKFCELWDGFTKTAVFYREGATPIHILLDDTNACKIPPEITEKNGLVYIGVFGDKTTNGEYTRRTTEPKAWYLQEGVAVEGVPSEPTPDIYAQIIVLCSEAVKSAKNTESLCENAETLCEKAKELCKEAENLANDFPIIQKNTNTIVAKGGNHTVGENCNDGMVIGKDNKYNEGRYSVIFGVDNEVTGHSNVVSGSHNVVKGLHNLVVGNKLRVDDDGTAQVIFGLGEDVPVSKDVAIAYYNLGKKTFEVLKDGTLTLNDKRFVSMPVCEPEGEDYILQCDTINKNYSMDKMITKGGTQYCHRMVVSKLQVPETTPDWAGHQITFHHIDAENKEHTESFIIKVVEQRADNRNQWNIDFYRSCSYWEPHSDADVRAYWNGGFTITGGTYSWLSKNDLFEEIKAYINNN